MDLNVCTLVGLRYHTFSTHPLYPYRLFPWAQQPTQETDNTISFGDTADTPIFFDQPMQDFSDNQSVTMVNEGGTASHQPSQPSQDSLPSVPMDAGISL
jgi:hypothetical protein